MTSVPVSFSRLFRDQFGLVSVELALYTTVIVVATLFAAMSAEHVRFHNNMERAAGTLAEVLVNQSHSDSGSLSDLIEAQVSGSGVVYQVFAKMAGIFPDSDLSKSPKLGLSAVFLDTNEFDASGNIFTKKSSNGDIQCQSSVVNESEKYLLDFAEKLKVNGQQVKVKLVLVEVCALQTSVMSLRNIVFPKDYYSFFIASAKE